MPKRVKATTHQLQKTRYYKKYGSPIKGKRRWNFDEIELVVNSCLPDVRIVAILRRSLEAIQIKRCRVKRVR